MFVAWICVSLAHASWTLMSVTQAKNIQEGILIFILVNLRINRSELYFMNRINNKNYSEFEKLDKIPVQRFFEEYLSKGNFFGKIVSAY